MMCVYCEDEDSVRVVSLHEVNGLSLERTRQLRKPQNHACLARQQPTLCHHSQVYKLGLLLKGR